MRVIGYARVSTAEQGDSGAGLAAQRAAIEAWCTYRGAELVRVEEDVASGKTTNGRCMKPNPRITPQSHALRRVIHIRIT